MGLTSFLKGRHRLAVSGKARLALIFGADRHAFGGEFQGEIPGAIPAGRFRGKIRGVDSGCSWPRLIPALNRHCQFPSLISTVERCGKWIAPPGFLCFGSDRVCFCQSDGA